MTVLIASEIVTLAVTVATTRFMAATNTRRIATIERRMEGLPKDYVPRSEVELGLKSLEATVRHTNQMVQALIFGRRSVQHEIKAAADLARNCTQITIAGTDGRGGLNLWEGRVPFFYLDNREIDGQPAPLVTIGCGCALDLDEALTLPFTIDGRAATLAEIAADFAAVRHAPFGMAAGGYSRFTRCRLSSQAIDDLMLKRFAVFICALRHTFPSFDEWPETVKAGCLDLIYGTGVARFEAEYKHFIAAGQAVPPDFEKMAAECASNQGRPGNYDARNRARAALFLHPELG